MPILYLVFFFLSCGQLQMQRKGIQTELYRAEFLKYAQNIEAQLNRKNFEKANTLVQTPPFKTLKNIELAYYKVIRAKIFLGMEKETQALFELEAAIPLANEDRALLDQIYLFKAKSYFRLKQYLAANQGLQLIVPERLQKNNYYAYQLLKSKLAKVDENPYDQVIALLRYLEQFQKISVITKNPLYQEAQTLYNGLSLDRKMAILAKLEGEKLLSLGNLAVNEISLALMQGRHSDALNISDWIDTNFSSNTILTEKKKLLFDKKGPLGPPKKVIGVILPLTGKFKKFGMKALIGIESALDLKGKSDLLVIVRDSRSNPLLGAMYVRELASKFQTPLIIGGLHPKEAQRELQEASKHGVFFISYSQILDEPKRDHLIEIPGSVRSQVTQLLGPENLEKLGNKVAIIYPQNDFGQEYVDALWDQKMDKDIKVTSIQSYPNKTDDYRSPVSGLLGVRFPRERKEELDILDQIYELKGKRSIRRIQTLTPIMDFDWIFFPGHPDEAIRLIPTFKYFDAKNITIVGVPSWKSHSFYKKLDIKSTYFIGNQYGNTLKSLHHFFISKYKRNPSTTEIIGFESMNVAMNILKTSDLSSKQAFLKNIKDRKIIEGPSALWTYNGREWIKKMHLLQWKEGRFSKLSDL